MLIKKPEISNGLKFIITVDTEADNQWKKKGKKPTLENIFYLPRFQKLCQNYGFPPTYLVTYEVAADKAAVEMLSRWQAAGQAEVGAHLHPWTNPPFSDYQLKNPKDQAFPSELADKELRDKLKSLTEIITANFGQRPSSYRAGRFGFDERTARYLLELGFLVDCSVTPKISWSKTIGLSGGPGGPDFRPARVQPYFLSLNNVCEFSNSGLLELPITIIYTGRLIKENSCLAKVFNSWPDNMIKLILNKLLFKKIWLRIFQSSKTSDWLRLYQSAVRNNLPVIEFMIHSSELMPGSSPYAKTEKEVDFIYYQLETMFKLFKSQGVGGVTLSAFAKNYDRPV